MRQTRGGAQVVDAEEAAQALFEVADITARRDPAALDHLPHRELRIEVRAAGNLAVASGNLGKLVLALQVHPQLRAGTQRVAELHRRLRGDALLASNQLVDEPDRAPHDFRKFRLRPTPCFELLLEELAGCECLCDSHLSSPAAQW